LTTIVITPPSTTASETIKVYESVTTQQSTTDRAGNFSMALPFHATASLTSLVVGTDVVINQDGHIFRGFIQNPPVTKNGPLKVVTVEGLEYAAKTQNIIVNEAYTANSTLDSIVSALATAYLPFVTALNIDSSATIVNVVYSDRFLWDVLEELCALSGFGWNIDKDLVFNFYSQKVSFNTASITYNNYHKGTASFAYDSSKLVNKLWVKGANAISGVTASQTVVVTTANITLDYKPHRIAVKIGTASKTVGIQNVDLASAYDFLLNYNEKLLIPALTTTGTAVITYHYEYPVRLVLYNDPSSTTYGQLEDIIKVTTNDRDLATQIGITYLNKHANPILVGSISPFSGNYRAGEAVRVTIPDLGIDDDLIIKSTSYSSTPTKPVVINLSLENRVDDITDILKQFNKRLDQLEKVVNGDLDSVVEQYRTFGDIIVAPTLQDDGISFSVHDYLMAGMPYAGPFYI